MKVALAVIFILVLEGNARGEPIKKGRVMCEGPMCTAHDVPTGSVIERAGDFSDDFVERVKRRIEVSKEPEKPVPPKKIQSKKDRIRIVQSSPSRIAAPVEVVSNLPHYYQGVDRSEFEASEKVVYVAKSPVLHLKGIKPGDVVRAVVEQEIVASPSVPTPVRAIAVSGVFLGAIFSGEAILDRELKRILFNFTRLRIKDRSEVYSLKAAGLSQSGSIGLEGEYVSQTGKFFIDELASAVAAGLVDSTINRNQTALGSYVQEPSLANAGKVAAVTALSKTTERMAENVRNAPEYTKTPGYQEIQIIIQDDPTESGS